MHNLTKNVLTKRVPINAGTTYQTVAGTTAITYEGVDLLGYDAYRYIVAMGAITANAVTSIKLQQSDDDAVSDGYSDLAGTSITIADTDDDKLIITDVIHPQKRWSTLILSRGTQNAAVDSVVVELYRADNVPITKDATVATQEIASGVSEGTA